MYLVVFWPNIICMWLIGPFYACFSPLCFFLALYLLRGKGGLEEKYCVRARM